MKLNGNYRVDYTISGEKNHIEVFVELKQKDGLIKFGQNVYEGFATLNGNNFNHIDLSNCVNAQFMAESIVLEEIEKLRKKHGKKLRIKKQKS